MPAAEPFLGEHLHRHAPSGGARPLQPRNPLAKPHDGVCGEWLLPKHTVMESQGHRHAKRWDIADPARRSPAPVNRKDGQPGNVRMAGMGDNQHFFGLQPNSLAWLRHA